MKTTASTFSAFLYKCVVIKCISTYRQCSAFNRRGLFVRCKWCKLLISAAEYR